METKLSETAVYTQLITIAEKLQNPLSTLRALNQAIGSKSDNAASDSETKAIIEYSQKVIDIVDGIVVNYQAISDQENLPLVFDLYHTLPTIQSFFSLIPNHKLIAKTDIEWLVLLENTVFREISKRKINLIDLAYELAVSESQLHRNTKRFLGLTPNNYIRILKLHKAQQYLKEYTYRTISEVSHAVGFTDAHYFSQVFLYQYGVLPKAVRPA